MNRLTFLLISVLMAVFHVNTANANQDPKVMLYYTNYFGGTLPSENLKSNLSLSFDYQTDPYLSNKLHNNNFHSYSPRKLPSLFSLDFNRDGFNALKIHGFNSLKKEPYLNADGSSGFTTSFNMLAIAGGVLVGAAVLTQAADGDDDDKNDDDNDSDDDHDNDNDNDNDSDDDRR